MDNEQNVVQPVSAPDNLPPTPKKRPRSKPFSWKKLGGNALILAFAAVVVIFVWSFVSRTMIEPPVQPQITVDGKSHTIQLDVLNGSGVAKLSQRFTDYLRARGFDVVETGNYKNSQVELTRVVDRAGQIKAAQQVAVALGVPKDRVVQEIDRNAYVDVSVVIGKDFRVLKPFSE